MTAQATFLNRVRSLYNIDAYKLPEMTWPQWEKFRDDPARYLINADDTQATAIWREVEKRQGNKIGATPTKPGFYWAKWKINDGTIDPMFDTSSPTALWEVVEVYLRDYGDDPDAMYVWLMGVPGTQPAENFYWGPGPFEKPASAPRDIVPETEKQYAARRRYQNMTPDEREEFLQAQRRSL